MTETEYARKLDELDRLLNDPDVPMEPAKVWSLLAEIAQRDLAGTASHGPLRADQEFPVALGACDGALDQPCYPPFR
jgi:hypothetical protein